jgi:HJR/Mrr/RecB family endonuclease
MGYETDLTPSSHDNGRDVIARRAEPGRTEYLLIQCKLYKKKLGSAPVRELLGSTSNEQATGAKIVTNSFFTRFPREEFENNHRVELVDGVQLVGLLNEHLGQTWPTRLDRLASERKRPS